MSFFPHDVISKGENEASGNDAELLGLLSLVSRRPFHDGFKSTAMDFMSLAQN